MPPELGVSNAWLPLTHSSPASLEYIENASAHGALPLWWSKINGLWFYFAAGCSDLLWNVSRTLLARNRCHAALRLEHLACPSCTEQEAAERAGERLLGIGNKYASRELGLVQHRARTWLGLKNVTMGALLAECARGLHGNCSGSTWRPDGTLRLCSCLPPRGHAVGKSAPRWADRTALDAPWRVAGGKRALTLSILAGAAWHDPRIGRLLRKLQLDTLQLWQQPQGGGSLAWTTEVWDVRELHLGAVSAERRIAALPAQHLAERMRRLSGPPWRLGQGTTEICAPSSRFVECLACANSSLEAVCAGVN